MDSELHGKKVFTFLILTYNHEDYIIQNLESIKYQIINYGKQYRYQLILSDDASKDETKKVVRYWISQNDKLFEFIDINFNNINLGICKNLIKAIRLIKGDYVKFMAGDDLFASESIFNFVDYLDKYDLVMGIPLQFKNNRIDYDGETERAMMQHISTELFYEKDPFNKRIKRSAFLNAPCVFFRSKLLQNEKIIEFVNESKVIDDHSMWLKMAFENENLKYKFIPKIVLLYRRTEGSAYIIKKNEFYYDRIKLFEYVIKTDNNLLTKLIQYNKMYCFKSENPIVSRYFDIGNYSVKMAIFLRRNQTRKIIEFLKPDIEINKKYYEKIVIESNELISTKDN